MDEDISAINTNTRNEKIKNFFINNKKRITIVLSILILLLIGYFTYGEIKKKNKIKIADQYNSSKINFLSGKKIDIESKMVEIIYAKDKTYSPLALYFLLDNNLLNNKTEVNKYFDILINDVDLDKEIKNLIIYKKGLYNSETGSEEEILNIFKPLINKDNLWRSHALYIIAEYFFSKNEMQKSKEFFEKILELKNSNPQIKLETQKRLQRDFSA